MLISDAIRQVRKLAAAFPHNRVVPGMMEIFARALSAYEPQVVDLAVAEIIATRTGHLPAIADVLRRMAENEAGLPKPSAAWGAVMTAIRTRLMTADLEFEIVKNAVKALGGIRDLGLSQNPQADRARFLQLYCELRDAEIESYQLKAVPALRGVPKLRELTR